MNNLAFVVQIHVCLPSDTWSLRDQVLQSAMDLLQIATGITKCDDYYKLRQYNPPPPPGAKNALQIMSLAAYARETDNVLLISIILAKRDLHNDVSWRLLWRFIVKHGRLQSVFTGRQVPRRDVS